MLIILALGALRQEGFLKLEVGQGSRGIPCFHELSVVSSQGRCGPWVSVPDLLLVLGHLLRASVFPYKWESRAGQKAQFIKSQNPRKCWVVPPVIQL